MKEVSFVDIGNAGTTGVIRLLVIVAVSDIGGPDIVMGAIQTNIFLPKSFDTSIK